LPGVDLIDIDGVVEAEKPFYPVEVGFFGSDGIVQGSDRFSGIFDEFLVCITDFFENTGFLSGAKGVVVFCREFLIPSGGPGVFKHLGKKEEKGVFRLLNLVW